MSEIKQYDTEVRLEAVMGTNHYGVHIHAMTAENLLSKSDIAVELAWRDLRIEQLIAQLEASQKNLDEMTEQYVDRTSALTYSTLRAEKAEAELSAANEKLSKRVEFPDVALSEVITAFNRADTPQEAYMAMREALRIEAGFTVEE